MDKIKQKIKQIFSLGAAIPVQAEALALIFCFATSVWLLVDPPALRYLPYSSVLAGVGIGMCLMRLLTSSPSKEPMAGEMAAWKSPIDILAKHDLRAHYYLPAAGVENRELAEALRKLASTGYIITDLAGNKLIGKVVSIPVTTNEIAEMRRAEFKVVK